jgi:Tol biopolymer transport system component
MTTFDRFDPFERRIGEALDGIAPLRRPDYLDDILQLTARSSQRRRWSFPGRWLPVDTTLARPTMFGRIPIRQLIVLAVLVALAAAALAFYVGTQKHVPPPFGLAANGQIAYVVGDDIYVRDTLTGVGRPLIVGPNKQFAPSFSPDGTRIAYASDVLGSDPFLIANADGSNPVQVGLIPPTGNAQAAWAPDSRRMALIYDSPPAGVPTLFIVAADGSSRAVDLGGLKPHDVAWLTPAGDRLLIRAEDAAGRMDFYAINVDGSSRTAFGLPGLTDYGPQFTLSGMSVSPDRSTIAYNGIEAIPGAQGDLRQHFRIHLVAADGTNDRSIPGPSDPFVHENWPVFSPDGKWIVAQRWKFDSPDGGLVLIAADGSEPTREIGPQSIGGELSKTWAPDGSRILVMNNQTNEIYLIDPVSGSSERITWAVDLPDWQRVAR